MGVCLKMGIPIYSFNGLMGKNHVPNWVHVQRNPEPHGIVGEAVKPILES